MPRSTSATASRRGPVASASLEGRAAGAAVRRLSGPAPSRLVGLGLIGALLGLAALGWAGTGLLMGGMDMGPGTRLGGFGFWAAAWVVMMAAMMLPAIYPMVLMYARVQAGRRARPGGAPAGATAAFVSGYLVAWGAAGIAVYGAFELAGLLPLGGLDWDAGGRYVAGGVIVGAAGYQLTPLKDACLRRCRSPLAFMLESWRPGRGGAVRMGVDHGGWCIGCCWALMAALFALGVMSIAWMAFIAALIAIEKLLPWRAAANAGVAGLLIALGLAVALAPDRVPGLTLP